MAASMGLALKNAKQDLVVVGTDRNADLAARMQKLGAVDRLERRPAHACKEAGLVIISEPFSDMPAILEGIAPDLSPGTVVTDTAPLKSEVMRWAEQFLPENVPFVGGHPLVAAQPGEQPRADLLTGAEYCLVPGPRATEQAVDVVSGLIGLLGAKPYFLDALEHDGLMAAVEQLPGFLQLALMATLSEAGSWRDNMRAISHPLIQATTTLGEDSAQSASVYRLNRQNLAHQIDAFQATLSQLKATLLAEEEETFNKRVTDLHAKRFEWLRDRGTSDLGGSILPIETDKRSVFSRLFLPDMRRPDKKSDKS